MVEGKERRGLLVKDDDGNMYFLRPEILEACRVKKTDVEIRAISKLPDVSVIGTLAVDKPLDPALVKQLKEKAASTVMCPW